MIPAGKGMVSLSASLIKSGKMSNILNINVQDVARPASIAFATNDFVAAMEQNAVQAIKIGNNVTVYDQYDRKISNDALKTFLTDYAINLTVTGNVTTDAITVSTSLAAINVTAADVAGGSGKIEFKLIELGTTKELDTVSTPISVVKTGDITSYTINTADAEKVLYASVDRAGTPTARDNEYAFTAKVYGKTDAGTQVLLAGTPIVASSITNGDDFAGTSVTTPAAFNGVKVNAKGLNNNRSEASTDLVITVAHNNAVKPLTVTLKSSTAAPVANEIKLKGADGDGLVVNANVTKNTKHLIQKYAPANIDFDGDGTADKNKGAQTDSSFYFYIADSYGKEGMTFVSFRIAKVKKANGTVESADKYTNASIDNNGVLTIGDDANATGDVIYVTAVTNNGRYATMMIQVQ
jgi:hypothetical protein